MGSTNVGRYFPFSEIYDCFAKDNYVNDFYAYPSLQYYVDLFYHDKISHYQIIIAGIEAIQIYTYVPQEVNLPLIEI